MLKVKMEQDMAMRQAEEEAMRHHQFKANPLPKSTTEPRCVCSIQSTLSMLTCNLHG